jgi:hypothetical protein
MFLGTGISKSAMVFLFNVSFLKLFDFMIPPCLENIKLTRHTFDLRVPTNAASRAITTGEASKAGKILTRILV